MDESSALLVTAVRAVETGDADRVLLTDADRSWASRAAAEVVGEGAAPEAFVARRARLAFERLSATHRALRRAVAALRWRPWVGGVLVAGAFVLGVAFDRVGGTQRINLLAPPLFTLLSWNLVVYVALAVGAVRRLAGSTGAGPLRSAVMRLASRGGAARAGAPAETGLGDALRRLPADWAAVAAPLYAARSARILHLAAAAMALGVLAGLYTRGLAFEYRATWESTFLDAPAVHALLAFALAPGAWLTGVAVPDAASVAALRAPASENAARWLHLIAGGVVAVVVVPRLLLAALAGFLERRRARNLALSLDDPYFQRLLRSYRGGPTRLTVVPYSYATPPAAMSGLEAIAARAFGGATALVVLPPVAYGDEDAFAQQRPSTGSGPLAALFAATATPEKESHGAFLAALAGRRDPAWPLIAIVDESGLRERWGDDAKRQRERRALWQDFLRDAGAAPLCADLTAPDLAAADAAIDAALGARPAPGATP
jgi:hypothetical protein